MQKAFKYINHIQQVRARGITADVIMIAMHFKP